MCKCLVESAVGAQRPVAPFYSHFNKEWIRSSIPVRAAPVHHTVTQWLQPNAERFSGTGFVISTTTLFLRQRKWERAWVLGLWELRGGEVEIFAELFTRKTMGLQCEATAFFCRSNGVCFKLWEESSPEPARIVWHEKIWLYPGLIDLGVSVICYKPAVAL